MTHYQTNGNSFGETSTVAAVPSRPAWKRPVILIPVAVGLAVLGVLAAGLFSSLFGDDDANPGVGTSATQGAEVTATNGGDAVTSDASASTSDAPGQPAPRPEQQLNSIQSEARDLAASYLQDAIYSRARLIEDVVAAGYREPDAAAAIDSLKVDWNDQAVQAAEVYVEKFEFTRTGLIAQLEVDGFESHQAQYGASAVGL